MSEKPTRQATPLFIVATVIWGSTWLGIKYQLGVVPSDVSVAYRFALAALILAAWCALTGRSLRFTVRQHLFIAVQGALLFGFNYIGVYWAEEYATSGLVAVLFSTIVFMNPIAAHWLFDTPLTSRTLVAAGMGVLGVALLFLPELAQARQGGNAAIGIAYGLGATAIASGGNMVAVRNNRAGLPVLPSTAWGMGYGAVVSVLAAIAHGSAWTFDTSPAYLASLLYLALFGSVIAFGAYLTLLKQVGPGPASYVGVGTPIVALALSTLFESYRWSWVAVLGLALAVTANVIALSAPRKPGVISAPRTATR
ncbi:MAG TPA: EamA family transporter [Casimicrobiaceae bacterium]|nr:EamA family transporter [Casimicrobiaceae bacterium]